MLRGNLAERLSSVLWALRMTPTRASGETPFKLSHGSETLIPVEFSVTSSRVALTKEGNKSWMEEIAEDLRHDLDLSEELRDTTTTRQEEMRRRMTKYFDKHVRIKQFVAGDLLMKKVDATGKSLVGKLNPNWEGPYIVKEALKHVGYQLQDIGGNDVIHSQSGDDRKRFYS